MRQPLLINTQSTNTGAAVQPLPPMPGPHDEFAVWLINARLAAPSVVPAVGPDDAFARSAHGSTTAVFENVSFAVRVGECVALCGSSGSGKVSLELKPVAGI